MKFCFLLTARVDLKLFFPYFFFFSEKNLCIDILTKKKDFRPTDWPFFAQPVDRK